MDLHSKENTIVGCGIASSCIPKSIPKVIDSHVFRLHSNTKKDVTYLTVYLIQFSRGLKAPINMNHPLMSVPTYGPSEREFKKTGK